MNFGTKILTEACQRLWNGRVVAVIDDDAPMCPLDCRHNDLVEICRMA